MYFQPRALILLLGLSDPMYLVNHCIHSYVVALSLPPSLFLSPSLSLS